MLTQPTIDKLQALHLSAMAQAFEQQRGSAQHAELHFDDRFGLLVDAEWTAREQRRPHATFAERALAVSGVAQGHRFHHARGLVRDVVLRLGTGS